VKTCTPKDVSAYRQVLLEKGLGYRISPALCEAVLESLGERDRNLLLAGRFSYGKAEILVLPPDEKVLRRFAKAFRSVATPRAPEIADEIEASLEAGTKESEEPEHDHPGWDRAKGRWTGEEKRRLAKAGYAGFETTPPGGYPPRVRGDARERLFEVKREKGVETFCVPPWRLHAGGDIASSSAVQIVSETQPGKMPSVRAFEHEGRRWVSMGSVARGPFVYYFDAYELVPAGKRVKKGKGHYAGAKVLVRGEPYVFGPKARFVPDNAKVCR
jgi:hypothetical protein